MGKLKCKFKKSILLLLAVCLLGLCGCGSTAKKELPQTVTCTIGHDGLLLVEWPAEEGAEFYRVYRKLRTEEDYSYIDDVYENSYSDSDYTDGQHYSYKISVIKNKKEIGLAKSSDFHAGNAPVITALNASEGSVTLSWIKNGAIAYKVYSSEDSNIWKEECETESMSATIVNPSARFVSVTGVFNYGSGEKVESAMGMPVEIPQETEITGVIQSDQYTAVVMFNPVPDADHYEVYRSTAKDGGYLRIGNCYSSVYYDRHIDDTDRRFYYYKVCACTDIATGKMSQPKEIRSASSEIAKIPAIMYHMVVKPSEVKPGEELAEYAIYDYEFEEDLKYLQSRGYNTITGGQYADYLEGKGTLPSNPILLTFDDGSYSVYENAWPLLKKYNMVASLAVIGDRIDEATADPVKRSDPEAPFCTWEEVAKMSQSGYMEIVSHSYSQHVYRNNGSTGADLKGKDEDEAQNIARNDYNKMIETCKEYGVKYEPILSYPYSYRSESSDKTWIESGFRLLYAGESSSVSRTYCNYITKAAGSNFGSAVIRRQVRLAGDPLSSVLNRIKDHDNL